MLELSGPWRSAGRPCRPVSRRRCPRCSRRECGDRSGGATPLRPGGCSWSTGLRSTWSSPGTSSKVNVQQVEQQLRINELFLNLPGILWRKCRSINEKISNHTLGLNNHAWNIGTLDERVTVVTRHLLQIKILILTDICKSTVFNWNSALKVTEWLTNWLYC